MSATPNFPQKIWDGKTPNTDRVDLRKGDAWCNHADWHQIREEVIALQEYVLNLPDDSGHVYLGQTSEEIDAGQVIRVRSDGNVEVADNLQSTVAGVAIQTAAASQPILYVTGGRVSLVTWSLTPGDDYFVISDGGLTNVAPTSEYLIRFGQAQDANTMDVNIQRSIRL